MRIGQRFRVCFVGFPCTDNAAMSWYWFERGTYNERQPLTVYPLIFSRSRYEADPRNSESARAWGRKMAGRESADSLWRENDYNGTDKFEESIHNRWLSNLLPIYSTLQRSRVARTLLFGILKLFKSSSHRILNS